MVGMAVVGGGEVTYTERGGGLDTRGGMWVQHSWPEDVGWTLRAMVTGGRMQ